MSVGAVVEEILIWVGRAVKLIPAIQGLWTAVRANDEGAQFAAQMELVRQIRTQQAREEFTLDDPDDITAPGGS